MDIKDKSMSAGCCEASQIQNLGIRCGSKILKYSSIELIRYHPVYFKLKYGNSERIVFSKKINRRHQNTKYDADGGYSIGYLLASRHHGDDLLSPQPTSILIRCNEATVLFLILFHEQSFLLDTDSFIKLDPLFWDEAIFSSGYSCNMHLSADQRILRMACKSHCSSLACF